VALAYEIYLSYFEGFFNMPENLTAWGRHICFSSEGILSPLKFYRPWPFMNPQTLSPVASTLTTRPPRTTIVSFFPRHVSKGMPSIPQTSTRLTYLVSDICSCFEFFQSLCMHLNFRFLNEQYIVVYGGVVCNHCPSPVTSLSSIRTTVRALSDFVS
jgi:hypothetical protein